MGVKLTIYNDIKARIEATVTEINTVKKFNNQFTNEDRENPVQYPVAYIGFSSMEWIKPATRTSMLNTLQQQQGGRMVVTIYLGFSHLEDEEDSFPIYEPIIQKVWQYLQGWSGTNIEYGALVRIAEREDNNHDGVIVWEIDFEVGVNDCGNTDTTLELVDPVTLDLSGQLIITPSTQTNLRTADDFDAEHA
jgi:hypothetical protein